MAIWDSPAKANNNDIEAVSTESTKCPNCASNLLFDAEHGACLCRNCGSVFDPESLNKVASFDFGGFEKAYDGTVEVSKEDEARIELVCDSCGAQIVTDKNTSSTFCAFCGSPAIVTKRLTRQFKPDYIIPFKFDKARAVSIFEEYCAGIEHLPKDFNVKTITEKMTGIYVPAWIISSDVEVDLKGFGYTGKSADDVHERNYTDSSNSLRRLIYGRVNFRLKDVPFDGEKNIPDRLMAAAEPFDFTELVSFKAEYLQGFFAQKYDELPIDMTDVIYKRLDRYSLSVCGLVDFGFDSFIPEAAGSITKYRNLDIKYALLPVWFLNIEYNGRRYHYIVNGQTGKVSGEFPYAKGWETIEKTGKRSKMKVVGWNEKLRYVLYGLPFLVFLIIVGASMTIEGLFFLSEHPLEYLLLLVTAILATYMCSKILPKVLFKRQKQEVEAVNKKSSHEMASEPGAEAYYDSSYPFSAVETNGLYVPLNNGWKYVEQKTSFDKNVMPEAQKGAEDTAVTDFEKQGRSRHMMQ
jgi:ribosomal protein L37AE/L43A